MLTEVQILESHRCTIKIRNTREWTVDAAWCGGAWSEDAAGGVQRGLGVDTRTKVAGEIDLSRQDDLALAKDAWKFLLLEW